MKALFRWLAGSIAFYLALYLVDSLISPRFHVGAVWAAVLIALILGMLNSPIRPLQQIKKKPAYALGISVLTVLVNALILQIFVWAGESLSTTSAAWVFVTAAFITLLSGTINWLIGFKKKEKPGIAAREKRTARASAGRDAASSPPTRTS